MAAVYLIKNVSVTKRLPAGSARVIFATLSMLAILVVFMVFKSIAGLTNERVNAGTLSHVDISTALSNIPVILYEFQKNIFGIKYWNITWILYICLMVLKRKQICADKYVYIVLPACLMLSAYAFVYMIAPVEINYHVRSSMDRLLVHVIPLAVLFIALAVDQDMEDNGRS